MSIGRRRWTALAVLCSAQGSVAQAQVAPGVRHPDNIAEAVLMAQLFSCTSAASERPAEGLNIPLDSSLTGVANHPSLPDSLAGYVGPLGPNSRILSLDSPEGPVWMAFDPDAKRCVVTGEAVNPGLIREKLMPIFASEESPWNPVAEARSPDGSRALPRYEWRVRATPRLGTPAVHLRATIDIPDVPDQQLLVVTEAVGD